MGRRRNILLASTTSVVSKNNYNYMTILALEDGLQAKLSGNTISYSLDEGNTWTSLASNTYTPTVNKGKTIMFKGNLTPEWIGIGTFSISKKCKLEGNCMSLLFGDDAVNNNSLSGKDYAFSRLFSGCTTIIQVSEAFLPATTLAINCYSYMFENCTGLTAVPELPATTLDGSCYSSMFKGCSSLTTALKLPATALYSGCYSNMFQNCTSLTTAPELPATTLDSNCYESMFKGCSGLTSAPELPATTLANSCYLGMFYGCTSLTVAPELPATTLASTCYSNMFYGCTSLTVAPELPATTLVDQCYTNMFYDCASLTTAPELPVTTLANYCYSNMFHGCTSLTVAPELPATTLANSCYLGMFSGCTSLTVAPELPATTLANYCYYNMFKGCSGLTSAPELPATTLANYCYKYMFCNCSNLNYIKMLAIDISATDCLTDWVDGVPSTGTFVKNPAMTSLPTGESGIPSGWTVVDGTIYSIMYTSDDGNIVTPNNTNAFGANIVSNIYINGQGIISFDGLVTTIGDWAFYGCNNLTSVNIPDSVTTIGDAAFCECYNLTSVTIPDSITEIGYEAFYLCNRLTSVYCKATTPPALDDTNVFALNSSGRKIYVPTESVYAYKSADRWSSYASAIEGYDFYSLTLPIKLYEGNNDLDVKLIIDYIKSLDTDGNGFVGGTDDGEVLKNIINFNDLYYPYSCWIEDDNINGGAWLYLSNDLTYGDVMGWRLNLDGTLVLDYH